MWLAEALQFKHHAAEKMLGMHVLYRFSDDEGGWALGQVRSVNADPKVVLPVESADGVEGVLPANFHVHYESDEATLPHRFDLDNYAASASADECGWVMLADPAVQKRKRPALADKSGRTVGAAPALLASTVPVRLLKHKESGPTVRASPRLTLQGPSAD